MEAFTIESGKAAPMLASNIDTDVIMPKQFLKGINRQGLDKGVFFDQRFLKNGELNPEFVLNKSAYVGAKFLVVGANFGCGSSREHAVWGLKQVGIRAIIGTTFAGIFFDNCKRNGVLTIQLSDEQIQFLGALISQENHNEITIDLLAQKIQITSGEEILFSVDPLQKETLLEGLDTIGQTLRKTQEIRSFEAQYLANNPWL